MESEGTSVVTVMKDPKSWQAAWFNADKKLELDFWLRSGANTNAPAKPATAGHEGAFLWWEAGIMYRRAVCMPHFTHDRLQTPA